METFRESHLGQLIRLVTRNKILLYLQERPESVLPWRKALEEEQASKKVNEEIKQVLAGDKRDNNSDNPPLESAESPSDDVDLEKQETIQLCDPSQHNTGPRGSGALWRNTTLSRTKTREHTVPWTLDRMATEEQEAIERQQSRIIVPQKIEDGIILVDWYSTDDPENPQDWHFSKKAWITWVL